MRVFALIFLVAMCVVYAIDIENANVNFIVNDENAMRKTEDDEDIMRKTENTIQQLFKKNLSVCIVDDDCGSNQLCAEHGECICKKEYATSPADSKKILCNHKRKSKDRAIKLQAYLIFIGCCGAGMVYIGHHMLGVMQIIITYIFIYILLHEIACRYLDPDPAPSKWKYLTFALSVIAFLGMFAWWLNGLVDITNGKIKDPKGFDLY